MNATVQDWQIREARAEDKEPLERLLEEIDLVREGLLAEGSQFWVVETTDGSLIGVAGLEYGDGAALLRSVGVKAQWRGKKISNELVQHTYEAARARGCKTVYCFSTDAITYWAYQKFVEVPVPELIAALSNAQQVHHFDRIGWLPTEVAWRKDL
jgi:N-acetylglutamate synthase-like GNAT family acetyltransferase